MPSSREAAHRHAQHFAEVLEATAELYQAGGESVLSGLKSFDTERANIERGREWAAANYESDDAALRLASAYPEAGIACLELRLPLRHNAYIGWRWAGNRAKTRAARSRGYSPG